MDAERLLRLLAEQVREHAVILLDIDGNVIWWSSSAERVFGYRAAEIVGQPVSRPAHAPRPRHADAV